MPLLQLSKSYDSPQYPGRRIETWFNSDGYSVLPKFTLDVGYGVAYYPIEDFDGDWQIWRYIENREYRNASDYDIYPSNPVVYNRENIRNNAATEWQLQQQIRTFDRNNRYATVIEEFGHALWLSINEVHNWQVLAIGGSTQISGGTKWHINTPYVSFQGTNVSKINDFPSNSVWEPMVDYYMHAGTAQPSWAFLLGLLNVNQDIANGDIEVSDELRELLEEDLYSGVMTDYATHWNINIDGEKNPQLAITWENGAMKDVNEFSVELRATSNLSTNEGFYIGRFNVDNQPQVFSWNRLYKDYGDSQDWALELNKLYQNFISNFAGAGAIVKIIMKATFITELGMVESSPCFANISYFGECTTKGLVDKNNNDGSYVTITKRSTDDVYADFPDSYDGDIDFTNYGASGISLMTKSYVMTTSRLKQLGNFLWNADFIDNIKLLNNSPIENIVSCKVFPFTVESQSDTSVVLGNIDTGILGSPIAENKNFVIDVGSFKIPKYYNNWLDYVGTTIGIFLPMCGFYSLDTESFMDKTMNVKYYIDILTGVCKVVLSSNGIPVQEFGGQIGFDIPLTAQNRSQTELEQLTSLSSAVSNVVGAKNAKSPLEIGANISGAVKDFADFVAPKDYFNTCGSLSPTVNMMTTHDVFLVIERPIVQYPSNYNHTYGKPCNLTLTLSKCKGFTLCKNVDVSTVPCTSEEKNLIKSALERGVYI